METVIYDDETIIGYSNDIVRDLIANGIDDSEEYELERDLIAKLNELDRELVLINYHPMGAYTCYKLEPKEMFVV